MISPPLSGPVGVQSSNGRDLATRLPVNRMMSVRRLIDTLPPLYGLNRTGTLVPEVPSPLLIMPNNRRSCSFMLDFSILIM